ncbi:MAG: excinuclease ABC subunit UvrA [SAR324 cluster bacterium]|nr:excinuclease ABC subunit UvrA [SAR324 cluster bacterium]
MTKKHKILNKNAAIRIRGAAEHNLKNVDIDIPRDTFVVITGLSGSGKSSLAFDTIYAEGQRRYVESLSAYARQFLDQMQKPAVESIEGLTPTISIEQRTGKATPRSTVATTTEIYDYLRVLFARAGTPFCPECDREITSQTAEDMVNYLLDYPEGTKLHVLTSLVRGKKGEHKDVFDYIQKEGFTRVRVDGIITPVDEVKPLKKTFVHDIEAVVDRIAIKDSSRTRLTDSIETALHLGDGLMIALLDFKDGSHKEEKFSEKYACPEHGSVLEELSPRVFSFNSPFGSCPDCLGLGNLLEPSVELVIPDTSLSLEDGAIKAWKSAGSGLGGFYGSGVNKIARVLGVSIKTPWKSLPKEMQETVLYGAKPYTQGTPKEGVIANLKRRFHLTDSENQRAKLLEFMGYLPCPTCHGKRLRPEILSVKIQGKNIFDISNMNIAHAFQYFQDLVLEKEKAKIAEPIKKAVIERLGFLVNVGLDYLTLDRQTNSLSGGEAQRIRLASQVGAKLVGVTYVLDEPTIGLHQRDNDRLLDTLVQLKDLGNTVIVVEHDEDVIRRAEYLIDMGPMAGIHGGEVVAEGLPEEVLKVKKSLTAQYLTGVREIPIPKERRKPTKGHELVVTGAHENNLKKVDAKFPLGLLICVTGVSGSGKSSLVNQCLLLGMKKELGNHRIPQGKWKKIKGADNVDKIINIDQSPIGRTSRSNPATYTGCFDGIRQIFAQLPEAKIRGYTAGRFSFNVKGGRCEACQGQGIKTIEMHFLPDVHVPCEACRGTRYNRETLQITFKHKNIADVLAMSIEEAAEYFSNHKKIYPGLKTLCDVGLDYLKLGQPSPTLSGGEAQRIKLASELSKRSTGQTLYILDEPTTGLHFHDIARLMEVLQRLVDLGNSVVVIEHNLDVIKGADWLLDLGPEGGDKGGMIVAQGTPEEVSKSKESHTARYLKDVLAKK